MHCLFCGKTLPLLKKLQKQEFCCKAHRQEHDRLALARLMEPKNEPELVAADFVVETVCPAAPVVEPLARAGALLWCAAVCLPGFDVLSAQPIPPAAPPEVVGATVFPGRTGSLPAVRDRRSQTAITLPGRLARADLHGFRHAEVLRVDPAIAENEPRWTGVASARSFSGVAVCLDAGCPDLVPALGAWPEPGRFCLAAAKWQDAPRWARLSPDKPWHARLAMGSVHQENVESPLRVEPAESRETTAASFAAVVVRPARWTVEPLAGVGQRVARAVALLPARHVTNTRTVPHLAPLVPVAAFPLPGAMALCGPARVWRARLGVALIADEGEPEAGPGQPGFLLHAAAAEPRDVPALTQLSPVKRWGAHVLLQRPRFHPLGFPSAPRPAPRSGLRDRVRNRWRLARTPLRVALLALPLIGVGLAMRPWAKQTFAEKVGPLVRERSAIVLEDDFRSGLSSWAGGSGWAHEWEYDPAGFIRPGKLALFRASLPLSDYRLELVGQIDKKSLGWVFRASDIQNFYAMKITIAKPGPLPQGDIVRYVMVNGMATDRVELPLPLSIRNDMLYRVETAAEQDRFTTSVNGQVVDTFRDRRHPTGGVGLFSEPGEAARVMRVRVADRDDLVGRICAYLSGDPAESKTVNPPIVRQGN